MVQLWTEHQGWVKDGLEIVRVKKSGVAIHQLPAFSGYAVNFRRYFYDSSKPRAERSSSKQLRWGGFVWNVFLCQLALSKARAYNSAVLSFRVFRYGAVALLWEAWMQYAVTMALLPKNKVSITPVLFISQGSMQVTSHWVKVCAARLPQHQPSQHRVACSPH